MWYVPQSKQKEYVVKMDVVIVTNGQTIVHHHERNSMEHMMRIIPYISGQTGGEISLTPELISGDLGSRKEVTKFLTAGEWAI